MKLAKVAVSYGETGLPLDLQCDVDLSDGAGEWAPVSIRVNHPADYMGLAITQDETGFSPRIVVADAQTGSELFSSFVALRTFVDGTSRRYHDFLPLHFLVHRITVTFYPWGPDPETAASAEGDLHSAVALFKALDADGQLISRKLVSRGEPFVDGAYSFSFNDARPWSSFVISSDPGYPVTCLGLWIGVGALVMRYASELAGWFGKEGVDSNGQA